MFINYYNIIQTFQTPVGTISIILEIVIIRIFVFITILSQSCKRPQLYFRFSRNRDLSICTINLEPPILFLLENLSIVTFHHRLNQSTTVWVLRLFQEIAHLFNWNKITPM